MSCNRVFHCVAHCKVHLLVSTHTRIIRRMMFGLIFETSIAFTNCYHKTLKLAKLTIALSYQENINNLPLPYTAPVISQSNCSLLPTHPIIIWYMCYSYVCVALSMFCTTQSIQALLFLLHWSYFGFVFLLLSLNILCYPLYFVDVYHRYSASLNNGNDYYYKK